MNCGYGEKLILYFYGEAEGGLKAGFEKHLAVCAACREELAALKAAESRLAERAVEPSASVVAVVMAAAREAVSGRRGFSFSWGEALLSGALASLMAVGFVFSGRAPVDLAWNSRVDSGLDSVEYSMYQAQSDIVSVSSDWDYKYSALEDEGLRAEMKDEG
ncbi:MAG: zf-HC2 domain-containing protein [Elusimicrobiales bacterium]|nr:zf-HC2 domain-containing protein [Elusimicrobiales bacterium]